MTVFLHQQRISGLHVVMKKIYNFLKKSELPMFIVPVKISWLIFTAVSGVEMKNLRRSEQVHFLVSLLRRSMSHSARTCASILVSTPTLAGSRPEDGHFLKKIVLFLVCCLINYSFEQVL